MAPRYFGLRQTKCSALCVAWLRRHPTRMSDMLVRQVCEGLLYRAVTDDTIVALVGIYRWFDIDLPSEEEEEESTRRCCEDSEMLLRAKYEEHAHNPHMVTLAPWLSERHIETMHKDHRALAPTIRTAIVLARRFPWLTAYLCVDKCIHFPVDLEEAECPMYDDGQLGWSLRGIDIVALYATFGPMCDWDTSKVTSMRYLFATLIHANRWTTSVPAAEWTTSCSPLKIDLSRWDVSNVLTMEGMFSGYNNVCFALGAWNVGRVTNFGQMFAGSFEFNHPLAQWDTSSAVSMQCMFWSCAEFNQPISQWNVSKVTDFEGMFEGCLSFNQPLDAWDTSSAQNMSRLFMNTCFNQPLNRWNVSNCLHTHHMFFENTDFNQPLDRWDVTKVRNASFVFWRCIQFNQDLTAWNLPSVVDIDFAVKTMHPETMMRNRRHFERWFNLR